MNRSVFGNLRRLLAVVIFIFLISADAIASPVSSFTKATTTPVPPTAGSPLLPQFEGYLFAYFEGSGPRNTQEQLRFAVSEDAVNWTALNGNNPVLASDKIS